MGNILGRRKRVAKVMKVDGTTLKLKPPADASYVLRDHPGYTLLDAEEVKRLGVRADPLRTDTLLKPGKLYFLVELPRATPNQRAARHAWSGALQVGGAKERLENLRLTRRSFSDLSPAGRPSSASSVEADETEGGAIRLRMRLPKAQVEKVVQESKDSIEAAQKIMLLCAAKDAGGTLSSSPGRATPAVKAGRKERILHIVHQISVLNEKELEQMRTSERFGKLIQYRQVPTNSRREQGLLHSLTKSSLNYTELVRI